MSKVNFFHHPESQSLERNSFSIHKDHFDAKTLKACLHWCHAQFGECGQTMHSHRWFFHSAQHGTMSFWFREDDDAFEFKMNWC